MKNLKHLFLLVLVFFGVSLLSSAQVRYYDSGTVYVSFAEKLGWSDYKETKTTYEVAFSYPKLILTDQEGNNINCIFSSYSKGYYIRDHKKLKKLNMKGLNSNTGVKVEVNMYEYDEYWSLLEMVEATGVKVLFKIREVEKE